MRRLLLLFLVIAGALVGVWLRSPGLLGPLRPHLDTVLGPLSAWAIQQRTQVEKAVDQLPPSDPQERIHAGSLDEFGRPPRPRLPVGYRVGELGGRFYESTIRPDPDAFNGGLYRAASFRVWVEDSRGKELAVGDALGSGAPVVGVEVMPARGAPSEGFSPEVISSLFLTRVFAEDLDPEGAGTVGDRVDVSERYAGQLWEARYPLPGQGTGERISALVHVVQPISWSGAVQGARYRYGVVVDLQVSDGKIGAGSSLYLGPTYRAPDHDPEEVSDHQWFGRIAFLELPRDLLPP